MAGLIDTAMNDPLKVSANGSDTYQVGSTATVDAATRTVDPRTETVAGQADKLMKEDSPLVQQAVAGAMRYANSRGLINSTMAASAGQDAALKSVLPIASADANVYGTASRDNQAATNSALSQNASAVNTTALNNANNLNQTARVAQQGDQTRQTQAEGIQGQKDLTVLSGQINQQLQTLKGDQATNLTNIESNYRQLIQTSQSASSFYGTSMQMLTAIMADTNTSAEQKQAAVDKVTAMMQGGLSVIGAIGNVDLAGLLDFTT